MDTWVSGTLRLSMYFFGVLQAWEERSGFTEIEYVIKILINLLNSILYHSWVGIKVFELW